MLVERPPRRSALRHAWASACPPAPPRCPPGPGLGRSVLCTDAGHPRLDTTCCESLLLTSAPWPRAGSPRTLAPADQSPGGQMSPSHLSQGQHRAAGRGHLCLLPGHQPGLCDSPNVQETQRYQGPDKGLGVTEPETHDPPVSARWGPGGAAGRMQSEGTRRQTSQLSQGPQ